MSKYKFLSQSLIELILALRHYDMKLGISEFALFGNFSDVSYFNNLKELEAKGWIVIIKDIRGRPSKIIIKDQIILAFNLFKVISKLWDADVPTAAKHFEKIYNDFKQVCKDGVEK